MNGTTSLLVLASAVMHAYWNYLLKRSSGGPLFVGLSKIAEVAVFIPLFLLLSVREAISVGASLFPLIAVGAALTLINYAMLAVAYRHGDLSEVYPVSRSGVLLFLPLLGAMMFNETVSGLGAIALLMIVSGIGMLQLAELTPAAIRTLSRRLTRSAASGYALLAALAAAGYTVWDKHAIQTITPFTYFFSYTVLVAIAYSAHIARRYAWTEIRAEWRAHRTEIVLVGVFNTSAYLLILMALRDGTSTYVIATRQLSVVFGVLLGWRLLGEEFGAPKRVGVMAIVAGSILVSLAR